MRAPCWIHEGPVTKTSDVWRVPSVCLQCHRKVYAHFQKPSNGNRGVTCFRSTITCLAPKGIVSSKTFIGNHGRALCTLSIRGEFVSKEPLCRLWMRLGVLHSYHETCHMVDLQSSVTIKLAKNSVKIKKILMKLAQWHINTLGTVVPRIQVKSSLL